MGIFRKLEASEIDVRVSTVKENGCSLLLYKDARVDQNILDETFGIYGWQRKHEIIGGNLYCTVAIKNPETGEWVAKQDVGTESYTEKEKGQASDSFKRACFNLGIGRELYTAPFIWINPPDVDIKGKDGKWTTFDRFYVKDIGYDEKGNINRLVICKSKTHKAVFTMGGEGAKSEPVPDKPERKVTSEEAMKLKRYCKKEEIPEEAIYGYFKRESIGDMSKADYDVFYKDFKAIIATWRKAHESQA